MSTLRVNTITDAVGTGSPTFPNGFSGLREGSDIVELGLDVSVLSNLLYVRAKQRDGATDPSVSVPAKISFRSTAATGGEFNQRSITAALSINTVAAGASFGAVASVDHNIYVYALDNSGTVELALSGIEFNEDSLVTTVAIGAGSTSNGVLYSTSVRSSVPIRLIGRLKSNQATAGTYATAIAEVALAPLLPRIVTGATRDLRICVAVVACDNPTPTITRQEGAWINGVTRDSVGQYQVTFRAGVFSATPYCWCQTGNASGWTGLGALTISGFQLNFRDNTNTLQDGNAPMIVCIGAR